MNALGLSIQPSILYGEHGLEKGITVPVIHINDKWSVDLASSSRWGGIGAQYNPIEPAGIFAGVGYDVRSKDVEGRVGLTANF